MESLGPGYTSRAPVRDETALVKTEKKGTVRIREIFEDAISEEDPIREPEQPLDKILDEVVEYCISELKNYGIEVQEQEVTELRQILEEFWHDMVADRGSSNKFHLKMNGISWVNKKRKAERLRRGDESGELSEEESVESEESEESDESEEVSDEKPSESDEWGESSTSESDSE